MLARTIALLLLIGVFSAPLWAQGQTCTLGRVARP